jgi:hypothetical protein
MAYQEGMCAGPKDVNPYPLHAKARRKAWDDGNSTAAEVEAQDKFDRQRLRRYGFSA